MSLSPNNLPSKRAQIAAAAAKDNGTGNKALKLDLTADEIPPNDEHRQRVDGKKGYVSARGASNLALPMAYLADFFTCQGDLCDLKSNPQGHIPVCVAENRLVTNLLHARLTTLQTAQAGFEEQNAYSYDSPLGLSILRTAVAKTLQEQFTGSSSSSFSSTVAIDPEHLGIGAGAVSIISNLFYALGSPKDAVLIPAPYYAAFDNDLRAFAGCIPVPIICEDPAKGPSVDDLEKARKHAQENLGLNVRFLLLTHPNNPLGVVYEPRVMKEAIGWSRSHQMDTIVDEIYALSVFDNESCDFQSIIQLYNNELGNDLHLIWGLSKDFGASGFRVGVLYTQNELLLEAMGNLISFSWVSHPIQHMMADLLNDKPFVETFLTKSRQRLQHSYQLCCKVLTDLEVPFVKAHAGMFVYLDLSELISTLEEEATFAKLLMERGRMVMTPGTTQHDPQPGKFRICYAYVSADVMEVGMERLRKVVTKIRQQGGLGDWIDDDSHWQDILS